MTEGVPPPYAVEPDRGFADRLERELVGRLAVGRPHDVEGDGSAVRVIDMTPTLVGDGPRIGRRSLVLVAAAAAVILVVASVVVLVTRDGPADVEVPAGPSPVSVGPSPTGAEAAPPTPPGSGDLVAALDQMGFGMDREGYERTEARHVYVYADGRVLTSLITGFVEQRLTPDGVELVRADILATGLFDPASPPPNGELLVHDGPTEPGAAGLAYGVPPVIRVHDGERYLSLPKELDQEWTDDFQQLQDRLWDLESWLPVSAWEDVTRTPWGSSMYTACRRYLSREEPSSDVLAALPAPAVELFTAQPSDGGVGFTIPRCVDLTIDEARQVGDVLRAAGFEQDGAMPDPFASEAIRDGNVTIRTREVSIDLTPQLPHGEPAQCCGGIG